MRRLALPSAEGVRARRSVRRIRFSADAFGTGYPATPASNVDPFASPRRSHRLIVTATSLAFDVPVFCHQVGLHVVVVLGHEFDRLV